MTEFEDFIRLAKFAGGRFDLVQAGGGNISLKLANGEIWIKRSGLGMSEMDSEQQCARLNTLQVEAILDNKILAGESDKYLRETMAQQLLAKANLTPLIRPSIETFFHVLLHKFTLHTHPIIVSNIVIRKDAKEWVARLFPDSVFVDYSTPGIDLAIAIKKVIANVQHMIPNIIFLKNHGLIISCALASEVQALTEKVVMTIEQALGVDYGRYRLTTQIADLYYKATSLYSMAYLSEDQQISHILNKHPEFLRVRPTAPDPFVFNGFAPLELVDLSVDGFNQYFIHYGVFPKVVIYQNKLFFIHQSLRKAKEMEEIFKSHLLALFYSNGIVDSLPQEELLYLAKWEAEKFRQTE